MSNFFLDNKEFQDDLNRYKIDDDMAVFHGFITALMAKGIVGNDKVILDLIKSVLNYDSPLPGVIIAHIISYILKAQRALSAKNYATMLPQKDDDHVLSLGYLAGFGYGLSLGLLHMPGADGKIDKADTESLDLFSAISELDANSDFDEESFNQVVQALCSSINSLQKA